MFLQKKNRSKNPKIKKRIPSFQNDSQTNLDSVQTLQTLSRTLFEGCTIVQLSMEANRQNRLIAQKEFTRCCRLLGLPASDQEKTNIEHSTLIVLRQQIAELEEEHINLHRQFISLQSQFRQVVKDQRSRLVGSINRTRALASGAGQGVFQSTSSLVNSKIYCDIDLHDDSVSMPGAKCA